jgi:PPOX class probable F420-dependent enzyme
MDNATMRRRLADARAGHLATVTPDRRPHVVPCCFTIAGDVVHSAVDAKPKSTLALQRLANVRANPATALLVDHYDDDWTQLWWIRVDGKARILDDGDEHADAIARLTEKYTQYRATPPPGPVLALDIERWRAWP